MIVYLLFVWAALYALWLAYSDGRRSRPTENCASADATPTNGSGPLVVEWTALDDRQLTRLLQQAAS